MSSVGFLERVLPRYVETRPLSVAVAVVALGGGGGGGELSRDGWSVTNWLTK